MANTYTQIYVQIIFAVQGRQNLITPPHRERLEKYMCGIISNKKSKPLSIYCNPDHTHILIGLHPSISISDIARDIKSNSSKWINENQWIKGKFNWQEGFGIATKISLLQSYKDIALTELQRYRSYRVTKISPLQSCKDIAPTELQRYRSYGAVSI